MISVQTNLLVVTSARSTEFIVSVTQQSYEVKRRLCVWGGGGISHKSTHLLMIFIHAFAVHKAFLNQKSSVMCFLEPFSGTIWVASLQVLVGKSTWSANEEYKTLLSGVQLMNPKDCRQEQNKQKLRMFKYGQSSVKRTLL